MDLRLTCLLVIFASVRRHERSDTDYDRMILYTKTLLDEKAILLKMHDVWTVSNHEILTRIKLRNMAFLYFLVWLSEAKQKS